ncbi:MAG: hypothetical protein II565_12420 [Fibrobacter sp.]|nr:hypothetical protein [Fibrobacter sp.]MBQ5465116.1 hypothetical protein [Fibrobacter sp.]
MVNISSDKRTNDFCNELLRSRRWFLARHGKHSMLRHKTEQGCKTIIVAATPSDSRAFANLEHEYKRYLRQFLIQTGVICVG